MMRGKERRKRGEGMRGEEMKGEKGYVEMIEEEGRMEKRDEGKKRYCEAHNLCG